CIDCTLPTPFSGPHGSRSRWRGRTRTSCGKWARPGLSAPGASMETRGASTHRLDPACCWWLHEALEEDGNPSLKAKLMGRIRIFVLDGISVGVSILSRIAQAEVDRGSGREGDVLRGGEKKRRLDAQRPRAGGAAAVVIVVARRRTEVRETTSRPN